MADHKDLDGSQLHRSRLGLPSYQVGHYFVGLRFRIGNSRFRLRRSDLVALCLLEKIREGKPSVASTSWLLSYRAEVRRIQELCPRAALTLVAATADDEVTRKLAIWLRGRCHGTLGAPQLLSVAWRSPVNLQAIYARAFQRMGAWAQLRALRQSGVLAERYPQHIVDTLPRPFSMRLSRYVSHLPVESDTCKDTPSPSAAERTTGLHAPRRQLDRQRPEPDRPPSPKRQISDAELWRDALEKQPNQLEGKPAKPLWLIRMVLDRIHWLVSGQRAADRLPEPYCKKAG